MTDRRTALYRLRDDLDVLLYVGIAYDPESRWKQHAGDKPWWSLVSRREVEWHVTRAAAEAAERSAILEEAPLYNSAGAAMGGMLSEHFPASGVIGNGEARSRLSELLDNTQFRSEHAEITRRGKPAGYLVPPDWYEAAVAALAEIKALRKEAAALRTEHPDA